MAQSLAAFTPIKFSLKLVELLYNATLYPNITNTNYEGSIKDSGDRVRVRTSAKVSLSDYTRGTTLVRQDLNPTSEDMIIDQLKYFSFGVDDVDKIQNDINTITEYASNSKRDMSELIDTNILAYGAKSVYYSNAIGTNYSTGTASVAATTGVVTGSATTFTSAMVGGIIKFAGLTKGYYVSAYTSATSITVVDQADLTTYTGGAYGLVAGQTGTYTIYGATAIAATKSTIYKNLVDTHTAMSGNLASREGRFIVVNAAVEGIIRQAPEFIPAVAAAYNGVVEMGLLGSIAGFKVYFSELIAGNNTTGYFVLAGTKDFMAFAAQIMKTSVIPSESDPNTFLNTCKGLLVFGRKVFEGNRQRGAFLRITVA